MGELVQTFNNGVGRPKANGTGADTISQRRAAEGAGISKRQEVTAVRIANRARDYIRDARQMTA